MCKKILQGIIAIAAALLLITTNWAASEVGFSNHNGCDMGVPWSGQSLNTSPDVTKAELEELVTGNSAFAFDFYQAVRAESGNLIISPYSISTALAMTYAGARGGTEQQMAQTLHFTLPQDRLHPAFNALALELARRREGQGAGRPRLNLANALWGQLGLSFLQKFLDTLGEHYRVELTLMDFARTPEECGLVINNWVSKRTEGRIKNLIPPGGIGPLTKLVLTNAIHFKAAWHYRFDRSLTRWGSFQRLDGSRVTVPMMRIEQAPSGYAQGENYQAVELPYLGGEMAMVLLLPAEGQFEVFERALDANKVAAILRSLRWERVNLSMPRFEFESSFHLGNTLAELGMPDAFSFGKADFSGMTGGRDLDIANVYHKGFIMVNEDGTEAAGGTAVVPVLSWGPVVTMDRPFIFLIRDIKTGAVLFVGRVLNPVASK